jgi:hypothetical protein
LPLLLTVLRPNLPNFNPVSCALLLLLLLLAVAAVFVNPPHRGEAWKITTKTVSLAAVNRRT